MNEQIQATVGAAVSTKLAYLSSGGVVVLGWYLEFRDIGIISGILIAAGTSLTNLYFKIRDDQRKQRADKRAAELHEFNTGVRIKSNGENRD